MENSIDSIALDQLKEKHIKKSALMKRSKYEFDLKVEFVG